MADKILCPYALGAINYKSGVVTSCPQQSDHLHNYATTFILKPSDIINSEKFKEHRKELMSGVWPTGCHLCQEAEAVGAKSMRQDFDRMPEIAFDLDMYNEETGEIDFKAVKHVELRFSNSCNMACLHCSDVYSSGWMSKLKHYVPTKEDKDHKLIQLTREFHKKSKDEDLSISISIEEMETIVDDLNANFPNLIKIDFSGGEVLYQKQFFPCLRKLADHPNASEISLTFHSNFNARFDPEELANLLKPFRRPVIHMSLDAGKNIYPYFRTGQWEVLKDNVAKFRAFDKITELDIVCTTSVYQIMDIENVFESFMELDVDIISSSIVYTPRYLNPALMVLKFSEYVKEDLLKARNVITREHEKRMNALDEYKHRRTWDPHLQRFDDLKRAMEAIDDIEKYIFNYEPKESEWDAFMVYIRKTDEIWKHNFNDFMVNYKYIDGKIERVKNV